MKKTLRLLFFSCFVLWCAATAIAAPPGDGESKTLLFLRNHVSFESGFSMLRVKSLTEVGQGNMRLSYRPGMFLGCLYHINVNDYFALRTGGLVGVNSFRFDFEPGMGDSSIYEPVKMSVAKPYLSIPLEMNARLRIQQRHVLGVVAGVSVNLFASERLTAATSLAGNPQGQELYKMELRYQQPNPFVNFEMGMEYLWVLRNMDMVKFGLKYSAGIRPMFYAHYEHKENDRVLSSGSFNSFNDHISLSIGYVFTRVNKLLDK